MGEEQWQLGSGSPADLHGSRQVLRRRDNGVPPERVFFDGEPHEQVGSDPLNGQFAVDAKREAWLADYPANHTV
jgi:hypothetical protein